jgi:Zn-dependent alcohol dehydrogenase
MERMNRRKFIGTTVAGTVAMTTMLRGASSTGKPKLKTALIGCGGYGMSNIRAAFKVGGVEIIALCDIDSQHLNKTADAVEKMQGSRAKTNHTK